MSSAYGRPILVDNESGDAHILEAIPLQGEPGAEYSESWLQKLLFRHPEALPITELDQTFEGLIPVCQELSTPAGFVDVLYVTPQGRLAVVEVKLWRNPEARRKVIGQVLDYAKELGQWSYESLDAAVRQARRNDPGLKGTLSLFEVARRTVPDLDERQFIDGVSLSLSRGDLLLLIVGDGIRQGVGAITEFLEGHGTLHFTFGLVEMAIFREPAGRFLVQPRVLAQSTIVRRLVVSVSGVNAVVQEDAADSDEGPPESEVDPNLLATRRYFTDFWAEFLDDWQLDDQNQPMPKPSISTNVHFYMPGGSKAWVSAYVAKSKECVGVYLTFARGPIAERLYSALYTSRADIDEALDVPVLWESEGEGKYFVAAKKSFPDVTAPEYRREIISWLRNTSNRFVTVFRPRIEQLMDEIVAD